MTKMKSLQPTLTKALLLPFLLLLLYLALLASPAWVG